MQMTLGISGAGINDSNISGRHLGYEVDCMIREAEKFYDEILLIDPTLVIHLFDHHEKHPQVFYKSRDISGIKTCIFRSITGAEEPVSLLARNLHYCGCDILDPPERFTGAPSGKLFDSLKGFSRKILPKTYFAFNLNSACEIISIIHEKKMFPVVIKPGKGKRGENVELVRNYNEGMVHVKNHFNNHNTIIYSLIIQQYIEIEDEFRGIVLGGKCLGLVKKIAAEGKIARNASQGGTFFKTEDETIVRFIEVNASKKGLIGIDVARDITGKLHYIESNRSPQWKSFEAATGVNVARILVEYAAHRMKHPSELF